MAEKLFITFVGKSFLYLCIYFLFLYFLVDIIGISIYTIQPFSKGGIIGLLIYAGLNLGIKFLMRNRKLNKKITKRMISCSKIF